jgi:hypothetical protein
MHPDGIVKETCASCLIDRILVTVAGGVELRLWRPNPTCRVVSANVARCRSAPLPLSSDAADCRWVSAVTGANNGAANLPRKISALRIDQPSQRIVQRRPPTSKRYVVSFVVSPLSDYCSRCSLLE